MGCDIHLYTERLIDCLDGSKKWICCDNIRVNPYYDPDNPDGYEQEYELQSIHNWRNYDEFAALADVRNSGYIEPIDNPRGLPDDVSKIVKEKSDRWGIDGHSHSWLTAGELFEYDNLHPYVYQSGLVRKSEADLIDKYGLPPRSWCEWTNAENYHKRSWKRQGSPVKSLVKAIKEKMKEVYNLYDWMGENRIEEQIYNHAEDFRIVFWFDN